MRLTHLVVASDLPSMVAFYRDAVGLRVGFDDRSTFTELRGDGPSSLLLLVNDQLARVAHADDPEALLIMGVADIDAACRRVADRGISLVTPPRNVPEWGMRIAAFRDPEGNLVELSQRLRY